MVLGGYGERTDPLAGLCGGKSGASQLDDHSLISDVVFCNNGGTITLNLKDLKPGRYRMKTLHHLSEDYGNTKFDIRVTDADGNGTLVHNNVGTSHGSNPQILSMRDFSFLVNQNSDDVNVSIGPGGDITNHMGINGFELKRFLTENPTSIDLSNNRGDGKSGHWYGYRAVHRYGSRCGCNP